MVSITKINKDKTKEITTFEETVESILLQLDMNLDDIKELTHLSPYLILDGHRSGVTENHDMMYGYMEGATFSLRFSEILKKMGGKQATFLIHTLRNYKTTKRMDAIFDAINKIGNQFITLANETGIKLKYVGKNVRTTYQLANLINYAEKTTENNSDFDLIYLTNYSDSWAMENINELTSIPEINVIARFTKGHYSGAFIPNKASKANFLYIQQASINDNWTDAEIITLILSLLKSHISLNGFVGGKEYKGNERAEIHEKRELEMWEDSYVVDLNKECRTKRILTFSPFGPINIKF